MEGNKVEKDFKEDYRKERRTILYWCEKAQ